MVQILMSHLKARLELALRSATCSLVAAVAAAVALGFFCAAGFIALAQRLGTIDACLIFGGAFAAVGILAMILLAVMKSRAARQRARFAQSLGDPQTLAAGVDIARLLGGRRAASVGLVSAFAIGILLSRSLSRR